MVRGRIQSIHNIAKQNSTTLWNFSYISLLQVFIIVAPLITYPYLVRVLGTELYGWVILAQIVASYGSIIMDFGFNVVCARHISINRNNREKLSEIMSSVLTIRFILWVLCFAVYLLIICLVREYKEHLWLFIFSFGITFNELLFPQFYFQGIEKMKYITNLNIVIRSISMVLIFLCIKDASNYFLVPALTSLGFLIGGILALYIIFIKDRLIYRIPSYQVLKYYFKDASLLFFTNIISTIKDKLNYILLGHFVIMNQVVIYDLGSKFANLLSKPADILCTVLLPQMAKERNIKVFKKIAVILVLITIVLVLVLNIFLSEIVQFFIAESIDLLPIRIYSCAPVFLGVSIFIASNLMIAFGYNKYLLHSIFVTTGIYLLLLVIMYYCGYLNSVVSFAIITVLSYVGELFYRILMAFKIIKREQKQC